MVEPVFGQVGSPVDAIDDLQRARLGPIVSGARIQPFHERRRLARKADANEPVEREGRIPDPRIPIVPVAHPTDFFRQAAGRGGDDGAGGLERHELERKRGAGDHLPPAARVAAVGDPVMPELHGGFEGALRVIVGQRGSAACSLFDLPEHADGMFSAAKRELTEDAPFVLFQRQGGRKSQCEGRGRKDGSLRVQMGLVRPARVIKGRMTLQPEGHAAAHHLDASDQLMKEVRPGSADRHEVLDLAHAFARQKPRDQDIAVGPIELLGGDLIAHGGDAEAAALLVVEDRGKHARGIEMRKTQPINAAVAPHQRRRAHVADDAVILDGVVGHGASA